MAEIEMPIQAVQVEALVVMKIIKHSTQSFPTVATGSIVGMDVQGVLEITNAFPFPVVEAPSAAADSHHDRDSGAAHSNAAAAAPRAKANVVYEREMIKMLRDVNVDANNAGWYTSTSMGSYMNLNTIENQFHYQKEAGDKAVALVHDVSRSAQGALSLRAFRLSPQFMAAYKDKKFTTEQLQKSNLRAKDIFVELPVQIHNSHLLTSYLHQLPAGGVALPTEEEQIELPRSLEAIENGPLAQDSPFLPNFNNLALNVDPFLEKNCDLLLDSLESYYTENNNFQYYQRAMAREQVKINAWQAKRAAENASRAALKQPLLPEDEWKSIFKLPPAPSRLDAMVNTRQVEQYSKQIDGFVAATTGKMFAVKANLLPNDAQA
ncbi:hypothetical protein KEM52_002086 [Ascosphaera acerosa]|nr:hypothetical protein KEM52_002086 [Ascosphaera acerosa]